MIPRRVIGSAVILLCLLFGVPAAADAQAGKSDKAAPRAAAKQLAPAVRIASINTDDPRRARVCVTAEDRGGGVDRVELSVGGRPVDGERVTASAAGRGAVTGRRCPADAWSFEVRLLAGPNRLEARAYATDGTVSPPQQQEVVGRTPEGTLYILTVGIDSYAGPLGLTYAVADARTFRDSLAAAAAPLFRTVVKDSLFDAHATVDSLKLKFGEIIRRADTSDTFVFFFAGHGTVAQNKGTTQFYLAPANVTDLSDKNQLFQHGISAWFLQGLLSEMPTRDKLIVLDACQSGELVRYFDRTKGGAAAEMLTRVGNTSRTAVLAAASPSNPTAEAAALGHGLFTAAILRSLAPRDQPEERSVLILAADTKKELRILTRRLGLPWSDPYLSPDPADFDLIYR